MPARTETTPHFGVEEEFLLLDASTGLPRDGAEAIIKAVPELRCEHEFFHSQVETATPVCDTAEEALESLRTFRSRVAAAASAQGLVLAGTGLPPVGGSQPGTVVSKKRYLDIDQSMRGMVTRYYSTGTHVHVEVPSRDVGVDVIARVAPWSPALVALTANSPIWMGRDSGYASWRYLSIQQWPSSGYPPHFTDAASYDRVVDDLVKAGALLDKALINWTIRLSEKFPTIELRTADAQLHGEDSVAFAIIFRGLVSRALRAIADEEAVTIVQPDLLRGAHWMAARDGLTDQLVDPRSGAPGAAHDVIDALLAHIADDLEASGDLTLVERYLARRRREGAPAELQRAAWESGGIRSLLGLYRGGHEDAVEHDGAP